MKKKIFFKRISLGLFFSFLSNIVTPIICAENEKIDKESIENLITIESHNSPKIYQPIDPAALSILKQKDSTKLPFAFEESILDEDLAEIIFKSAPEEVKTLIKNYDARQKKIQPFPVPKQIVLHGPCGTGKSDIGRLIANKFGKKGLIIRCSLLGSEWRNSENANLTREVDNAIESVKRCYDGGSSAVIILEEIDSLLKEDRDRQPGDASMASLLDGLMKMPAILIFTTNDLSCISSRFKDRCCYQTMIEIPKPNQKVQTDIVNYFIDKTNKEFEAEGFTEFKINKLNFDLTKVIKSNDFSIRMLKALFDNALREALRRENNNKITFKPIDFKIANDQMVKSSGKIEREKSRKELVKFIEKYGPTILGVIGIIGTVVSIAVQIMSYKNSNNQQKEVLQIQKEGVEMQRTGVMLQKECASMQYKSLSLQSQSMHMQEAENFEKTLNNFCNRWKKS